MGHLSQIQIFYQNVLMNFQAMHSKQLSCIFKTKIINHIKNDFLTTILRMMIYLDSSQHQIFFFNGQAYYLIIIISIISHYSPFFQAPYLQLIQKISTMTINQSFSYFYQSHYYSHEELRINYLSFYQNFFYYY